ncbi:MAG: DUF808 domain-containing protein [Deltaproteobacteria bacterium]|jgi:predicted DNA repair protein MutK|nr:DUF808 domain-containing protein [Deltaproteobacteria bacterium]
MAGFTLLTLLDDVAGVLDDVALLTKTAASRGLGVVGDDLALAAERLEGLKAAREIPVVLAVAKGSLVNKVILIPLALALSAFAPFALLPLLMIGGSYLCLEGAEKIHLSLLSLRKKKAPAAPAAPEEGASAPELSPAERELVEKGKIRGAIRTDFVLSAEIVVIALSTIPKGATLAARAGTLCLVGLLMTVVVYGFVAGVVKLDDCGFWLLRREASGAARKRLGRILVGAAPPLLRALGVAGTAAMFLVGGGIVVHGAWPVGSAPFHDGWGSYPFNVGFGLAWGYALVAARAGALRLWAARAGDKAP